ncbi:hypothetical protein NON20_11675 [Synechocystis sp. B12]|nr:hypothetical protein NON20_11675 [Synechocystis sp. B12]
MSIMLQDPQIIRFYQKLTDAMVDLWNRSRSMDEIRLYVDGFIACLRFSNQIEPYLIHRLEEEVFAFLRDPSNFSYSAFETEKDYDYF